MGCPPTTNPARTRGRVPRPSGSRRRSGRQCPDSGARSESTHTHRFVPARPEDALHGRLRASRIKGRAWLRRIARASPLRRLARCILGHARTALVTWLRARQLGGSIVMRIEDIDRPRVVPGSAEAICRDHEWLGLGWDEGPMFQSSRDEAYEASAPSAAASRDWSTHARAPERRSPRSRARPTETRDRAIRAPAAKARPNLREPPALRFRLR